jgi:hypothetical protein
MMDPNAALSDLFEALVEDDLHTVHLLATSLIEWLDRGGFHPGGEHLRKEAVYGWLEMTAANTSDHA